MKFSSLLALYLYKFLTALIAPLAVLFICYKKRHDKGYGLSVFNFLGFYKGKKKNSIWGFFFSLYNEIPDKSNTLPQ